MFKLDVRNFAEHHLIRIVYNTLCAMAFIHEANIMHRDFKPANLLVGADCNVKVSDFGLSRTIAETCSNAKGHNTIHTREEFFAKHEYKVISKQEETHYIAKALIKSR